jgi:hypothetical protein
MAHVVYRQCNSVDDGPQVDVEVQERRLEQVAVFVKGLRQVVGTTSDAGVCEDMIDCRVSPLGFFEQVREIRPGCNISPVERERRV